MDFMLLVPIVAGILLVILVFRTGVLAYLYDARIGDDGLDFVLFSTFTLFTIPFSEITKVREVGFGGTLTLNAVNFCNRSLTKGFLIEKKSGWYARRVVITPADSAYFKTILSRENIVCS
jgi:hypothetical protein